MARQKRNRTAAEKKARRERKKDSMIIFINGKQKRVPQPPTIDGMPVEEFIARNADPIWLHQNEMWELLHQREQDWASTASPSPDEVDRRMETQEESDFEDV